jgi:pimeloyl-ACP methyl ester carboxylesterase
MDSLLAYEKFGDGPHRVIALHGWFGDQTTYAPLYDALSPEEFTYICPSYRGYGGSRDLPGEYTIGEIARDVIALADKLQFARFSLIGHSMGGMAVQRILADAPERVDKIVAVAPVPASGALLDADTYGAFQAAVANPQIAFGIVDFSTGNRLSHAWVNHIAGYPKKVALDAAFSGYLPSWAKSDIHSEIEGNPVPILVAVGEFDNAINEALMRETYMRWYPNAELVVIANSGHYPMNETPVMLATLVENFLRRSRS